MMIVPHKIKAMWAAEWWYFLCVAYGQQINWDQQHASLRMVITLTGTMSRFSFLHNIAFRRKPNHNEWLMNTGKLLKRTSRDYRCLCKADKHSHPVAEEMRDPGDARSTFMPQCNHEVYSSAIRSYTAFNLWSVFMPSVTLFFSLRKQQKMSLIKPSDSQY